MLSCTALNDVLIRCVYVTGLGTGAPTIESPYGDTVQPQEAPESISRAVASLPPEQMFELMKQMKVRTFAAQLFKIWVISFRNKNTALNWLLEILFSALKKLVFYRQSVLRQVKIYLCTSVPPPPPPNWKIVILNSFFPQIFKLILFVRPLNFKCEQNPQEYVESVKINSSLRKRYGAEFWFSSTHF